MSFQIICLMADIEANRPIENLFEPIWNNFFLTQLKIGALWSGPNFRFWLIDHPEKHCDKAIILHTQTFKLNDNSCDKSAYCALHMKKKIRMNNESNHACHRYLKPKKETNIFFSTFFSSSNRTPITIWLVEIRKRLHVRFFQHLVVSAIKINFHFS